IFVCSGSGIRSLSTVASGPSKRQRSTRVACSEKMEKLTPSPFHVAPSGYGSPGQTRIGLSAERAATRWGPCAVIGAQLQVARNVPGGSIALGVGRSALGVHAT